MADDPPRQKRSFFAKFLDAAWKGVVLFVAFKMVLNRMPCRPGLILIVNNY